jgi:hypothetical protein
MFLSQNVAALLHFSVLASWDDATHRRTMACAFFLHFWIFSDEFLTLASPTSNFNPLILFA